MLTLDDTHRTLADLQPRRRKSDYKRLLMHEFGVPPWSLRNRLRYAWRVLLRVFVFGDTTTVRAVFAASSFLFGLLLVIYPDTLTRRFFSGMAFGYPGLAEVLWVVAFWLHTAGVTWRFLDKPRIGWGFVVNAWGLFLWILSTYLQMRSINEIPPSISMELVLIAAGFVALTRTGLNDEDMSP